MFRMLYIQFNDWKRKHLVWLGFILGMSFELSFTLGFIRIAQNTGEFVNVLEPTIIIGSSAWNMLFLLLGLFLILSDSPFLSDYTPSVVMRTSRKKWFSIQILYIIMTCFLYYLSLSLFSIILCMSIGYIGNAWSHLLYSVASGNYAYQVYEIEFSNLLFMKSHTPGAAYAVTLVSQFAYATTLELIIFLLNTYTRRSYGICVATFLHVLGYVIFLEGLVGVKKMSLLMHSLPALHAKQYYMGLNSAPTFYESAIVFVIINTILVVCLIITSKRFDFIKKV